MSIESLLSEWLKQPGSYVTPAEKRFIQDLRTARGAGVGFGWMQQVIEWEWQDTGVAAWGPNYFNKEIARLEAELALLKGTP